MVLYRPRERVVCYHVPISILRCRRGGHPIFEMPPRSQGSITDVRSNEDIDLKSKFRFGSSSSSSSTYGPSCNSVCNSTPSCFVAVSWLGLPRGVPVRVVRTGHKRNTPPDNVRRYIVTFHTRAHDQHISTPAQIIERG